MDDKYDLNGKIFKLVYVFRLKSNVALFNRLIWIYCFLKGVSLGKNNIFNGFPRIFREPYSTIAIGSNCKFNSSRNSVRIGLDKRCSFATLNKGAQIIIGNNTGATGLTIAAWNQVKIGENVLMGTCCTIIDNDFHNPNPAIRNKSLVSAKPVSIEDNVFLGMNCTVLKGVTIGKNSVIAANSVILNDIPPNSFAMGNPCKLIMKRNWQNSD
jgi:acetyltransferase-like isoleucine patch superfamily enzyme